MADLIDFEEIINLNEIHVQNENLNSLRSSEDSLSGILDKMCETLDVSELEKNAEYIEKRSNDLDDLVIPELGIFDEDCVLKSDSIVADKTHCLQIYEEEEKSDDSVKPKSRAMSLFDTKEFVGNITDAKDGIDNKVEDNNTDECTADPILSPTSIALTEFNEIYKTACLNNDKFQKLEETKIVENMEKQYDDEVINLDEFDDINLNLIEANGLVAELSTPAIDVVDVIDAESDLKSSTNTDDSSKDNNIENTPERTRIANYISVIKEDLKDRERSHELKTVVIDVTNNDIISISSTESDDGYDSSDFEFITEDEAKKAGITVRDNKKTDTTLQEPSNKYNVTNNYDSLPDHIKYHRNRYLRCRIETFKSNRESHIIPEGDSLLNLFSSLPILNGVYHSSNKHVLPARNMAFSADGFGFDFPENDENSEFQDEADETAKKITSMYPVENRKRRRFN